MKKVEVEMGSVVGGSAVGPEDNSGVVRAELNRVAKEMAKCAGDYYMHIHRGWLPYNRDTQIVFGNDCYPKDARAKVEAETVISYAHEEGFSVSDIRVTRNGTWAIAVQGDAEDAAELVQVAWHTWFEESKKKAGKGEN